MKNERESQEKVSDENARSALTGIKNSLVGSELLDEGLIVDSDGIKLTLRDRRTQLRSDIQQANWGGVLPDNT